MKINFTKKILLFFISLFLYSCCKELRFNESETYWTDVYKKGDVITFKSNIFSTKNELLSQIDTIFILNKTENKPTGNCNFMVSNYDVEGCIIDYNYKHDSTLSEPNLFVQHFKENKGESLPVLRVYDMEFSRGKLKDTTVVLNTTGAKLTDCYTFHSKDVYKGWSVFKLKTFVWSKKMGLVMYIGENGQKFEYVEKVSK